MHAASMGRLCSQCVNAHCADVCLANCTHVQGGSGPSQEAGSAAAAIAASAAAASGSCSADDDTEQQTADQDRALTAGVTLELTHPTRTHEQTGQLQLKVGLQACLAHATET